LPWGIRVADLLYHLAYDPQADFGRSIYTYFITRGVKGLPDIKGQPALSFPVDLKRNKLAPPGYGKEYGHQMWRRLLAKYKNPELVGDAMQTVVAKLWHAPNALNEGDSLRSAEGFVFKMLNNWILDEIRKNVRHREDSLYGEGDEGEEIEFSVLDKDTLQQLDDMILPGEMAKIKRRIDREVHPDASLWIDLFLDGYTSKEIVGDKAHGIPSMLPHVQERPMSYQNWESNVKPKILHVFREELSN
jgi:DNA-directed RNA polymerase specialized sigma24 family protein